MKADLLIEKLISLGSLIYDAAKKNIKDGEFDYAEFLASDAPDKIKNDVKQILSELKPNELNNAVMQIAAKEQDLLGGKQITELSTDKQVQYSQLVDSEVLLNSAIAKRAMEGDFINWFMNDAFPVLVKIGVTVIPLLV